ncbi:prepilin-type N-terminal cleavage/methylation domain-containing protein [Rhodothalassium salexigens DSM 2132]|uniref:Prepilin-type N-terminal cleavage/methylation domain-containing protein n=1 Tax=Rhodothalassium salexigens DSM 2132 TaxID=1188247 RepID=A0A4V2SNY5_RHOSA|nr:prepilin-type N-terminal cleavage/methylation domain-containing protein [Rhodothalassium salexigens]TCP32956.1 prepilin-type N-terminal cleavage/methylation domain-containing protein [Rhodothalassium salexigens DSM 2132]
MRGVGAGRGRPTGTARGARRGCGHDRQQPWSRRAASGGFSLIEVIVTLAIVSLVSTILFQSVTTHWGNMQRIDAAFDRAREGGVRAQVFRQVVVHLLPAWPEQEEARFRGGPSGFSGLTGQAASASEAALTPFSIEAVAGRGVGPLRLRLVDRDVVLADPVRDVRVEYLALNGRWLDRWPPEENPGNGFFSDGQYFDTPPLPEAIRIRFVDARGPQAWIATVGTSTGLPFRIQDVQ